MALPHLEVTHTQAALNLLTYEYVQTKIAHTQRVAAWFCEHKMLKIFTTATYKQLMKTLPTCFPSAAIN